MFNCFQEKKQAMKKHNNTNILRISPSRLRSMVRECVSMVLSEAGRAKVNNGSNNPNEKAFLRWKKKFDSYLSEMLSELRSDYLDGLGLSVEINPNYAFVGGKGRWLAVYEKSSGRIADGVISIGINYPLFYSKMCKMRTDRDSFNIEAQARITVGHEIGHGLVDFIRNLNIPSSVSLSEYPNLSLVLKCSPRKEESLVEEFGEYQFPDATSCWGSVLCDALEELNELGKA